MNTIVYNPRQLTTFELSSSSRLLLQAVHKTEYRLSHATLNTTHRTFCLFIYFFFHIRNSHSCCVFFSNEFCLLVLCVRACNMEVFQTENFYIFVKKEKSLWWNRTTSEFAIKSGNFIIDVYAFGPTNENCKYRFVQWVNYILQYDCMVAAPDQKWEDFPCAPINILIFYESSFVVFVQCIACRLGFVIGR